MMQWIRLAGSYAVWLPLILGWGSPGFARMEIRELQAQTDYADCRLDGLTIDPDGRIALGSALEEAWVSEEDSVCWALSAMADGHVLAATADNGTVYRLGGDRGVVLLETPQVAVFSLLETEPGTVLAGTAPDGVIYRIRGGNPASVFARTDAHYIWDMVCEPDGTILVAAGLPASVLRYSPDGRLLQTVAVEAGHVRRLRIAPDGTVWLATADTGRVYRLDGSDLQLIIDTSAAEISALAAGTDGLWFATVAAPAVQGADTPRPGSLSPRKRAGDPLNERSTLWFMDYADFAPREVWQTSAAPIFDMVLAHDRPLLACGDNGLLVRLEEGRRITVIASVPDRQIVSLTSGADGSIWAGGAGPAALFQLSSKPAREGRLEAPVIDAGLPARWGRFQFEGENVSPATVRMETRTGNSKDPDDNWSDWQPTETGWAVTTPAARYLQWRLILTASDPAFPRIDTVTLSLLTANRPPDISRVQVLPVLKGQFVENPGRGKTYLQTLPDGMRIEYQLPTAAYRGVSKGDWLQLKGMRTVLWEAVDADSDSLDFTLDIARNAVPYQWFTLVETHTEPVFSFDSSVFPDGRYIIRITGSDRPAHPQGHSKETTRLSRLFFIDNTPPDITELRAALYPISHPDAGAIHITGTTRDTLSPIRRLAYSLDTEEWFDFTSSDDMLDSHEEVFDLTISGPRNQPTPRSVFIKVTDAHENTTTSTVRVDN
ncbi:hypothetical protein JXA80_03790 [bacterium]|nr:hypothetical protein [candidate division CSSED10-310 bacterium]